MTTLPAKLLYPGLGSTYFVQADEIDPAVVIGGSANSLTKTVLDSVVHSQAIARSKLYPDSLAIHGLDLYSMKTVTGIPLTASLASGLWATLIASNVRVLAGELADGNTKTSSGNYQYALPDNYLAGGLITIRVATKLKSVTGSGVANNGSDIDCLTFKQAHGAVGSDLCGTAAQTYAALDTWYDKDFVIDPTGLVAGDVLNFTITGRAIENDVGNGTLQSYVGEVSVLCNVQG